MPAVSRKGDELTTGHICATTTTLDTPKQRTVFANKKLIARITDKTIAHPFPPSPAWELPKLMDMPAPPPPPCSPSVAKNPL